MEIIEQVREFISNISDNILRLGSVLNAIFIVTIFFLIATLASRYLGIILVARLPREIALPITRITYIAIIAIGVLSALTYLGIDISVILVAGGVLGIALGFAAQTVVSNLLSGIFLYFDRPFKVGDAVSIGDRAGIVEDISIFSTRIRLFDGRLLRISNEEVFKSNIINLASIKARRVEYQITLSHGTDTAKAIEVIKRVVEREPLILAEPSPLIFSPQATLDGIVITIWVWTPAATFFDVWTTLLSKIRGELEKEGIRLAVPQRVIRIREERAAEST